MANFDIDRTRRVAGLIKRELAHIMSRELNDDRINRVTITHIDMSKDLKNAKVFVSSMDQNVDIALIERLLMRAAKFMRQRLSQSLDLRVTPRLQFKYDESIDKAIHLESLMQSLKGKDEMTFAEREAAQQASESQSNSKSDIQSDNKTNKDSQD